MVESPETTVVQVYAPVSGDDDMKKDNEGLLEIELETAVSGKPLTTSIRRTTAHIKSIGGGKARWRGLGIFVLYVLLTTLIATPLTAVLRFLPRPCGDILADIVASVITARLHCAWTHKVISMPSSKSLRERMVSRAQWRQLMGVTAMAVGLQSAAVCGIAMTFRLCALAVRNLHHQGAPTWVLPIVALVPGIVAAITLGLFVMIPSYASLVRKEASMLPEEEETIVSFDRSFGGRVTQFGTAVTVREAWQSFSWASRRNLVKIYVKFSFIMFALAFLFSHVLALELYLIAGPQIKEFVHSAHNEIKRAM